ncbi:DUF551 domain-containing protein [Klebsiella pneumoniae]
MTKSTITRERAQQIFLGNGPEPSASEERELARMALAAMDSEPVAEITEDLGRLFVKIHYPTTLKAGDKLYRHAQPEPVVPDDVSGPLAHAYKELTPTFMRNHIAVFERYGIAPNDSSTVIQALRIALDGIERRAAMLQPLHTIKVASALGSLPKTGEVLHTNSPVIPDGYVMVPKEPTESMINAWLSEVANWRGHIAGYKAMLAAAPQEDINALIPLVSRDEQEGK